MKKQFLLLACLLVSATLFCQNLEIKDRQYIHGTNIIKKAKFVDLLKSDKLAYKYYTESVAKSKQAKTLGIMSIGLLSGGISSFYLLGWEGGISNPRTHTMTNFLMLSSALTGTISIYKKVSSKRDRQTSLDIYNHNNGVIETSPSLDLSVHDHGIGLMYTF